MKSRPIGLIVIALLLCIALVALVASAVNTVHAVSNLQQQHALAKAGDVRTIRPWMTIPYIAHSYHVPESYLYSSLHISNNEPSHHTSLHTLAGRYKRPLPEIVYEVQNAITSYRRHHPRNSPVRPRSSPTRELR